MFSLLAKYKFMNYCMYNSKEHASFKKDPEFLKMVRSHAPVTVAAPGNYIHHSLALSAS